MERLQVLSYKRILLFEVDPEEEPSLTKKLLIL